MPDATFFFDPACPWTWRASRWLESVAAARHLEVEWRSASLAVLHEGGDVPDEYAAPLEASSRSLRLVEALRQAGRHDDVGRFYGELGSRTFEADRTIDHDVVTAAAQAAGLDAQIVSLGDATLDGAVRASTETAVAAAGPGVGSPVLVLPSAERGLHGPILAAVPDEKDALALWEAVGTLMEMPAFFELKRGRDGET
ncbi:MAG: DsbA family protein [Acidimicrobiia bacterium]